MPSYVVDVLTFQEADGCDSMVPLFVAATDLIWLHKWMQLPLLLGGEGKV